MDSSVLDLDNLPIETEVQIATKSLEICASCASTGFSKQCDHTQLKGIRIPKSSVELAGMSTKHALTGEGDMFHALSKTELNSAYGARSASELKHGNDIMIDGDSIPEGVIDELKITAELGEEIDVDYEKVNFSVSYKECGESSK